MIERITQSFMKSMRDYQAGEECGLVIKHMFVDELPLERKSDSMDEGSYFEYLLTGAFPKDGQLPQPRFMSSAKGREIKDMYQEYRRAHFNAQYVKDLFVAMDVEILAVGKRLTLGRHEGTLDLIVRYKGKEWIWDVKYSGLIEERWSKHGWVWTDQQKEYHGTQAKQYHLIGKKRPFAFLVVQNNNEEVDKASNVFREPDVRLFCVEIGEDDLVAHVEEGNQMMERLKLDAEFGFEVRASLKRCNKCPLKGGCPSRQTVPIEEVISLEFVN